VRRWAYVGAVIALLVLAGTTRGIVRNMDPRLAVQAAVVHDEWDSPDPWGNRWYWDPVYRDNGGVLMDYSAGPNGWDEYGGGDDIVPLFSFSGLGRDEDAACFPPFARAHLFVSMRVMDQVRRGAPHHDHHVQDDDRWVRAAYDRRAHVSAALIGWSRELFLGAALLLALAPHFLRQLLSPRSGTRLELVRASILASPLAALAALVGWCWTAAHASALLVVVSRPLACGLSGAAVAFAGFLLFRLSRASESRSREALLDVGHAE
jgi:hypothetical protein